MKAFLDKHFMKLWFTSLGVAYYGAWLHDSGHPRLGMTLALMATGVILVAGFITRKPE